MKAYLYLTNAKIELFGDPVGECLVLNQRLVDIQKQNLQELGMELILIDELNKINENLPYLLLYDDLYFTREFLREFLERSQKLGKNTQAGVKKCIKTDRIALTQEVDQCEDGYLYQMFYLVPGSSDKPVPVIIDTDAGFKVKRDWLPHILPHAISEFTITPYAIIRIIIPLHLHLANLMALACRFAMRWRTPGKMRVRNAVLKIARYFKKEKWLEKKVKNFMESKEKRRVPKWAYYILRHTNVIGKNCDIHPTAVLEGCVIGDGCRIGAFCYLQGSNLGNNVELTEFSFVRFSVIGDDCQIMARALISFSVIYPRSFIVTRALQFGLVGRETAIFNAFFADFRIDSKPMKVSFRGRMVESGMTFMGPYIGHRARIAANVQVAAGRCIPNGIIIYPNTDDIILKLPAELKEGDVYIVGKGIVKKSNSS